MKMRNNWNSYILMMGVLTRITTLQNGLAVSDKTKHTPILRPNNFTLRYIFKRNENKYAKSSFIHNSPNLEIAYMSMNKQMVANSYNRMLCSIFFYKRQLMHTPIWMNLKNNAEWKKCLCKRIQCVWFHSHEFLEQQASSMVEKNHYSDYHWVLKMGINWEEVRETSLAKTNVFFR